MSGDRRHGWGSRNLALVALGLNVVLTGAGAIATAGIVFVPSLENEFASLSRELADFETLALLVGGLFFLPWLHVTYRRARELASTHELEEQWSRGPVVGFFIPILNFWRPYQALRALDRALDPSRVPLAPIRMAETATTYREPAAVAIPDLRAAPSAPVYLWWTLWLLRSFGRLVVRGLGVENNIAIALWNFVPCAAAVMACVLVLRIAARLAEVERRRAALV
jgi:hypothetical protein